MLCVGSVKQTRQTQPSTVCGIVVQVLSATVQKIKKLILQAIEYVVKFFRWLFCCKPRDVKPRDVKPRVVTPSTAPLPPFELARFPALMREQGINPDRLNAIPTPIDPALINYVVDSANPPIQLNELLTKFNEIFADLRDDDILYNDQGADVSKRRARENIQENLIDGVDMRGASSGYHYEVLRAIHMYLRGAIFELRKAEIPLDKKKEVLKNLASAARHCPPRRHEECKATYLTLSNQMETVRQIVLTAWQRTKEALLRNYYSLSREPVQTLNFIRSVAGPELGLDCDRLNLEDIYIRLHDARSPKNRYWNEKHTTRAQFLETFYNVFPLNAVRVTKDHLNERIRQDNPIATQISQYIDTVIRSNVQKGVLTQAEAQALPHPYQDASTYELTDAGARLLLADEQLIIPQTPNGHLIRV